MLPPRWSHRSTTRGAVRVSGEPEPSRTGELEAVLAHPHQLRCRQAVGPCEAPIRGRPMDGSELRHLLGYRVMVPKSTSDGGGA